jgi:hypothetical protein
MRVIKHNSRLERKESNRVRLREPNWNVQLPSDQRSQDWLRVLTLDIAHPRFIAFFTYDFGLEIQRIPFPLSVLSSVAVGPSSYDLSGK